MLLIACEESQTVCKAFRAVGVEAYSCDILNCSGDKPEWHIKGNVLDILHDSEWSGVIAFPPCTDLAVSGARWFEEKKKDGRQQRSIDFFMEFTRIQVPYAIENPIGIMSSEFRKPDQVIQPFMFGEPFRKSTCLWLNNLPLLKSTNVVKPGRQQVLKSGKSIPEWYSNAPIKDRARIRSKTFEGIANAMAQQWAMYF